MAHTYHTFTYEFIMVHYGSFPRHDVVSISYGIGEVVGDFVRDVSALQDLRTLVDLQHVLLEAILSLHVT